MHLHKTDYQPASVTGPVHIDYQSRFYMDKFTKVIAPACFSLKSSVMVTLYQLMLSAHVYNKLVKIINVMLMIHHWDPYNQAAVPQFSPMHLKVDLQIAQCARGICALQSSICSYNN